MCLSALHEAVDGLDVGDIVQAVLRFRSMQEILQGSKPVMTFNATLLVNTSGCGITSLKSLEGDEEVRTAMSFSKRWAFAVPDFGTAESTMLQVYAFHSLNQRMYATGRGMRACRDRLHLQPTDFDVGAVF